MDKGPAPVYELEEEKTETLNFLGKDLTKKILKDGDGTELVNPAVIAEPKPRKSYKKRGFSESSKGSRPSSKKSKKWLDLILNVNQGIVPHFVKNCILI